MLSYVNVFLKTELTCIPYLLKKYIIPQYNNAVSNGITWLFFIWCLLHYCFAHFLNALFKRMCYKNYLNQRLHQSLWYIGFYTVALVYCSTTDWLDHRYRIELNTSNFGLTSNVFWGFVMLTTFFAHSAFWEGVFNENFSLALTYMLLTLLLLNTYLMKSIETAFGITTLISIVHIGMELARIIQLTMYWKSDMNTSSIRVFFLSTVLLSAVVYCIALPIVLLLPLGLKILDDPSVLVMSFSLLLAAWLSTEIITLPGFRVINHWLYHLKKEQDGEEDEHKQETEDICQFSVLECCMFPPRDDEMYNLKIYREEIVKRQKSVKYVRNPRKMFLQSIKCMLAIKRKLNRTRVSDSSDDSENSETDNRDTSHETDALISVDNKEKSSNSSESIAKEELDDSEIKVAEEIVDGKLQIRVSEET